MPTMVDGLSILIVLVWTAQLVAYTNHVRVKLLYERMLNERMHSILYPPALAAPAVRRFVHEGLDCFNIDLVECRQFLPELLSVLNTIHEALRRIDTLGLAKHHHVSLMAAR